MNIQKLSGTLCACLLMTGCHRSSTNTASSTEDFNSSPRAEWRDTNSLIDTNLLLTPTGRDTNGVNRIYPDSDQVLPKAPDNTGVNVRDRDDATLTPGDQGTSESDREITRHVRKGVMAKEELSTTAKNVKIITQDGKVTLRGPVKSESEQKAIGEIAQGVAGVTSVDNQLEVKSSTDEKPKSSTDEKQEYYQQEKE